jgi:hypothetical protein
LIECVIGKQIAPHWWKIWVKNRLTYNYVTLVEYADIFRCLFALSLFSLPSLSLLSLFCISLCSMFSLSVFPLSVSSLCFPLSVFLSLFSSLCFFPGEDGYTALHTFYVMIRQMFVNGNVGGTVVVVTKPKGW